MFTPGSTLSINSSKNDSLIKVGERVKLVSLIKAWRAKYDKMHTVAQKHREAIETLKLEIRQINEERDRVTGHLADELNKEKNDHKTELSNLREQVDKTQNEATVETRVLKEKLHRLQTETKPIIDAYKERDTNMKVKMAEMTEELQRLKDLREKLEKELDELKDESKLEIDKFKCENDDLKKRYQEKMGEVREHIALKISQVRMQVDSNAQILQNKLKNDYEKKFEILQAQSNKSVKEAENVLKAEYHRKIKENEIHLVEEKHSLTKHYEAELKSCKKTLELSKSKYRQSHKENQRLHEALASTRQKLQSLRNNLGSDFYEDVIQNHRKEANPVTTQKQLLAELAMRMREIRDLRRDLDRHERTQKLTGGVRWQEEGIKLEILHGIKVAEIEQLKKLIRQKQVEMVYKTKTLNRQQPTGRILKTPDLRPFVHGNNNNNLPVRTCLSAGINSDRREYVRRRARQEKPKKTTEKVGEDRSSWLTRRNSTVQYNPVKGGEARLALNEWRKTNVNRERFMQGIW